MPDRFLLIREQSIVVGGAAAWVVHALEDTYIILLLSILLLYIYIYTEGTRYRITQGRAERKDEAF